MKEFFLILFFSKTILLTFNPINISSEWVDIKLQSPIEAITSGASIYIKIPPDLYNMENSDWLEQYFPTGSIQAKFLDQNGNEFLMNNGDAFSLSNEGLELIMISSKPFPINHKYIKLLIKSEKKLSDVKIVWRNSKM